ncbi:MarR family winged helix-turn-helix transcriptional regulator [Kineosporia babensis]|uniref:MarR family transcriptional regulator n=1 Tax=Kineosporia babensis TaxID=499548 RepID=A0A9X1NGH5_9ACTN|nr:MarR family transcriptional regulator [Kineosporia babensis]MCD5312861.1 MarR family transcriptional regulator [Kineosporia babensis]
MSDQSAEASIEQALTRLRREQQANRLQVRAEGAKADAARYRYLDALDESPHGRPISEVAEAIGVDRPRASRLTTDLVTEKLIRREPHPTDARTTLVRLTGRGRTIVEAMHTTRRQAVSQALAEFSDEEAANLAALLQRFVDSWTQAK